MAASEIVLNVVFYALAIAAIAGAASVATSRNIVRSAFALLAVLFSAAALYAVMKADFIAAAQVLIYVGGILVLIIFAVMLTHRITDVKLSNDSTPGPAAFCACLCLLFSLVVVILFTAKWQREPESVEVWADGNKLTLRQYQADGATGLARGGSTFEGAVVLEVSVPKPQRPLELVEIRAWMGDKAKPSAEKSLRGPYETGPMRFRLDNLSDGDWRWEAKQIPVERPGAEASKEPGPVAVSAPGARTDFSVNHGITEPVARALAGDYLLAFEAVSVLLLAALVGAAFLARKEVRE
jgi:NADH:ubiquinone oxidoreductase subunit 6 (subunit J)